MKAVTKSALLETLESVNSCQAVSINTLTDVKMNKIGNPFYGRVTKASTVNGLIGFSYGNAVNNQLGREDKELDFKPHERKWGVRDGVLIRHKGKNYVELKVQSVSSTVYFLDGEEIELAELGDWVKKRKAPKSQEGIEKKIILADYNLDGIVSMRLMGEAYEIVEQVAEQEKVEVEAVAEPVA